MTTVPDRVAPLAEKVLLIGWDGADWQFITPLLEKGAMPNLAKLLARGASGNIASLRPMLSPVLWTSIATGKRAHDHGILGFVEPRPDGAGVQLASSTSRRTRALWNVLTLAGLPSHVVHWYASHPAEPIRGTVVTDHYALPGPVAADAPKVGRAPWPLAPHAVHPESLRATLAELRVHPRELGPMELGPFLRRAHEIDQQKPENVKLLRQLSMLLARAASVHAATTYLVEHEPWSLACVYYDMVDRLCHEFIHYHPPRRDGVPEADFEHYHQVLNGCYQFHDLMLGRLVQVAGSDALIIIVSDHGFLSDHQRYAWDGKAGPVDWHRLHGIFAMAGPGVKHDHELRGASLLDIAPTILHVLGLPMGADMAGKVLVDAFEAASEVRRIDTWEAVDGDAGLHPAERQQDAFEAHEALRQLVDLGYVAAPEGDAPKAIETARRDARSVLASSHIEVGRIDLALPIFSELMKEAGSGELYLEPVVGCLLALRRADEARPLVAKLIARAPEAFSTHMMAARWAMLEERTADAIVALERAAAVADDKAATHANLGSTFLELKRPELAERHFGRVLEIDPESPDGHRGLAQVRLARGLYAEAAEAALEAVGLRHHDPIAHCILAEAALRLGWPDRARGALEIALKIDPGMRRAQYLWRTLQRRAAAQTAPSPGANATTHPPEPPASAATAIEADQTDRSLGVGEPRRVPDRAAGPFPGAVPNDGPFVTVVSGLPRSGTSLVMQMLAAGGMACLTDGQRASDEDNPHGYFELEAVKRLDVDASWLVGAVGHAVKVIHAHLPRLPAGHRYRVLVLERDIAEIVASQRAMLARSGRQGAAIDDARLAVVLRAQLERALGWVALQPNFIVLRVGYRELIDGGLDATERITRFLAPHPLDVGKMLAAIDRTLYRQRKPAAQADERP